MLPPFVVPTSLLDCSAGYADLSSWEAFGSWISQRRLDGVGGLVLGSSNLQLEDYSLSYTFASNSEKEPGSRRFKSLLKVSQASKGEVGDETEDDRHLHSPAEERRAEEVERHDRGAEAEHDAL